MSVAALTELEQRAAFLLRLRGSGVRDLNVLRAMEAVPRAAFFPHIDPGLVMRDVVLPLPGGQSAERPSAVALALEALKVQPGDQVLEVGTGSGYVTALLVRLGARVTTVECRAPLADAARERLGALDLVPDALRFADGLATPPEPGCVDCLLLHLALPATPPGFLEALAEGGRLLHGTSASPRRLVLHRRTSAGVTTTEVGGSTAVAPHPITSRTRSFSFG